MNSWPVANLRSIVHCRSLLTRCQFCFKSGQPHLYLEKQHIPPSEGFQIRDTLTPNNCARPFPLSLLLTHFANFVFKLDSAPQPPAPNQGTNWQPPPISGLCPHAVNAESGIITVQRDPGLHFAFHCRLFSWAAFIFNQHLFNICRLNSPALCRFLPSALEIFHHVMASKLPRRFERFLTVGTPPSCPSPSPYSIRKRYFQILPWCWDHLVP